MNCSSFNKNNCCRSIRRPWVWMAFKRMERNPAATAMQAIRSQRGQERIFRLVIAVLLVLLPCYFIYRKKDRNLPSMGWVRLLPFWYFICCMRSFREIPIRSVPWQTQMISSCVLHRIWGSDC